MLIVYARRIVANAIRRKPHDELYQFVSRRLFHATGAASDTSALKNAQAERINELAQLNKTSTRLYRILLKAIPRENAILLQPPLNHRDYGSARLMNANKTTYWCSDSEDDAANTDDVTSKVQNENEILSFFNFWVQYEYTMFSSTSPSSHSEELYERIDNYLSQNLGLTSFESLLDRSVYANPRDIKKAIRIGFRLFSDENINCTNQSTYGQVEENQNDSKENTLLLDKRDILELQRFAIQSNRLLEDQKDWWERTSISVDKERGLRIMATSGSIGTTAIGYLSPGQCEKNRFSYRIRIENFNDANSDNGGQNTGDDDVQRERTYQLLGRTWNIVEESEQSSESKIGNNEEIDNEQVTVNAPTTGVVGHLPVIRPGEMFEYTSGCDLSTPTGTMSGCFHMAAVSNETNSAQVGDKVDALFAPKDKLFKMPVAPFRLIAKKAD